MPSALGDAAVGAGLLALFLLPAYLFLPSLVAPLVSTVRALFSSLLMVVGLTAALALALALCLVGEKAYRRWILKEQRPTTAPRSDDGVARGKTAHGTRLDTGSQIDAAAEKVIERLEQSSVGRLVRRKVRGATRGGGGGGAGDVELKELKRGVAGTTAVRRAPPPPPPR
ncbi:hypothetical protein JCM9279_007458 [Rhodotorula babjevae]